MPRMGRPGFAAMYDLPRKGTLYLAGRIGSFISFLLSRLGRKCLIFYGPEEEALLLKEELAFFSKKEVHLFPPFEEKVFEKEEEARRTSFLFHLATDDGFLGLFPYSAVKRPISTREAVLGNRKDIRFGDTIFQEDLIAYLEKGGYEPVPLVREEGDFAKRGSIIDLFPPTYEHPVRIEFFGDQVYSIRLFDAVTQRSRKELEACTLTPARSGSPEGATILDHLEEDMVLVHEGTLSLAGGAGEEDGGGIERVARLLEGVLSIDISGVGEGAGGRIIEAFSNDDLRQLFETRRNEIFRLLAEKVGTEWSAYRHVYLFASNLRQAERLRDIFRSYGVALPILSDLSPGENGQTRGIVVGPLRRGFRAMDTIILTEEDIVGPKKRPVKRRWDGMDEFLNSFKDLSPGEWVVHLDHGIGIFRGITELQITGCTKDFLIIEYQDGDKLYVPVEDLHLVQKYIGGEKFKPKIDRLGSPLWTNAKKRVRKQVEDIAKELLAIYAARELAQGHPYGEEDELFREMESRFGYEETEGQLKAIDDVLTDLKSPRPMDRLVCGDVGFGKTEVAIRASFKAVMDGKQVAILVPTTVLAQQHYKTFKDRFQDYPVNVEMLSRFRSREEQKAVIEGLKKGVVDIVIGTHRILQKDLALRELGLLIIDEEHRFGVKHKEKLKAMKSQVDVLTLTATPIPRTLHMATMGIRDLSVIDTPPLDRLAVKTSVVRFNDDLVRRAIRNELERGGQVFFVHNFIHNIGVVFDHLRTLLPDARIAVAHGRMEGKKLEKIMVDFIAGHYDVLLSTNIIESGLDISNVNTILINNAHRMGLADLYQLRGRVGRGTRQGYAYLLVPKGESLAKDASLRLKIIEQMTALGSGFQIANYDLEIRGAGNLLGKEQSGNINLVGFELYCSMLEEAVTRMKEDRELEEDVVTEINLPVDAFIPDWYIEDPTQKLLMYKRLSRIREEGEVKEMTDELTDRYGPLPETVQSLCDVISLKALLTRARVRKLEYSDGRLVAHVSEKTPLDLKKLLAMAGDGRKGVKLLPDGRIILPAGKNVKELMGLARNLLMELIPL